jgi:hypothetical protein
MAPDELFALEPGTVIEAGKLLAIVTDEPIVHEVVSVNPDKGTIRLSCSFFGVSIGDLIGKRREAGIEWSATLQ